MTTELPIHTLIVTRQTATLAGGEGWDAEYEQLLGGAMRETTSRRAPNNDFAWAVEHGKGRSVSIGIGHNVQAIGHPAFRALFPRSAEWVAAGEPDAQK